MTRLTDSYTGETYDTQEAELIGYMQSEVQDTEDFDYYECEVYRSQAGSYFVAGWGGARTRFARSAGREGWTRPGRGIVPVDVADLHDFDGQPLYEEVN